MARVLVEETNLSNVGAALRTKLNTDSTFYPYEMANAILSIEGYPEPSGSISITSNGTVDVKDYAHAVVSVSGSDTEDATLSSGSQMLHGVTAYAKGSKYTGTIPTYTGSVNGGQGSIGSYTPYSGSYYAEPSTVPQSFPTAGTVMAEDFVVGSYSAPESVVLGSKTITTNGTYNASESLLDGFSQVTVNVQGGGSGSISISQNGTYDVRAYASAVVSVSALLSDVTISANGTYTAEATGVDGFSTVTVDVEPTINLSSGRFYSNGEYDPPSGYDGYSTVKVSVTPKLRDLTIIGSGTFSASVFSVDGFSNIRVIDEPDFSTMSYVSSSAFTNAVGLGSLDLPNAEWIGQDAFGNCVDMTVVDMQKCSKIYSKAFYSCKSLSQVNIPSCQTIWVSAFAGCYTLTSINAPLCSEIGAFAFEYCSQLTSVSFPQCTSLGNGAFRYTAITEISMPLLSGSVALPFGGCSQLSVVYMPLVTSINSGTFSECANLSLTLGLTSVSSTEYFTWSNIRAVTLPNCTSICDRAFSGNKGLEYVSLQGVYTIPSSAFNRCTALSEFDLYYVTRINQSAFYSCNFSDVNLVDCSVIENNAFRGNSMLSNVNLQRAERLGSYAFDGCSSQFRVVMTHSAMCSIPDGYPFDTDASVKMIVPSSLYNTYIADSNWSRAREFYNLTITSNYD